MTADGYDFRRVDLQTKRKKEGEKRVTSILYESPQLFRGIYGTYDELEECIEEYNKTHKISIYEEESRLIDIKEVPATFGIE